MQIGIHLEQQIQSADPLQLICLYYRNAIGAVRDARQALAKRDTAQRSKSISLAHGVLSELYRTLDRTAGDGALAKQLDRIYEYMMHRLILANTLQQDAPLAEVMSLLAPLLASWESVSEASVPSVRSDWHPAMAMSGMEMETPQYSYSF